MYAFQPNRKKTWFNIVRASDNTVSMAVKGVYFAPSKAVDLC